MNSLNPKNVLGGIPGLLGDADFEMEKPILSSVAKGAGGVVEDFFNLVGDITGVESRDTQQEQTTFPSKGTLEFNKKEATAQQKLKEKEESDRKKAFYATLEQDRLKAQQAKEKMLFEEEINDITVNMSTEEKNRLLHYQSSYKDRSIYQIAALRKKIIEERKKADKQQKAAAIPSPAKQASALEAAYEGGSGKQGSGTANLSAQATG